MLKIGVHWSQEKKGGKPMRYQAADLAIQLNERGWISEIIVQGKNILQAPCALLTLVEKEGLSRPKALSHESGNLRLLMEDGSGVLLRIEEKGTHLVFCVLGIADTAEALVFGPWPVLLCGEAGEVLGIARGGQEAFGALSLLPKVVEGLPDWSAQLFEQDFHYLQENNGISVGSLRFDEAAAARLRDGSTALQFHCENRSRSHVRSVMGAPGVCVFPLDAKDPDAGIVGSALAVYGCAAENALERIGQIAQAEGLPFPLLEGEWAKTSGLARQAYLIADFTEQEAPLVFASAVKAGLRGVYHAEPFKAWGHFTWREDVASSDLDFYEGITRPARALGLFVGVHTLSNFITTSDAYVTPRPDPRLLVYCVLQTLEAVDERSDSLLLADQPALSYPQTLNTLRLGEELLTFSSVNKEAEGTRLTGLARGAFGTVPASHPEGSEAILLRDHPYRVLFPDIHLQDELAQRLGDLANRAGIRQISFDGLEGCAYIGHGRYAMARFLRENYARWQTPLINDASRLTHYGWHIHTRMNWGEPWGEAMREGQVDARLRNQAFFKRNLLPRMLGWFLIRLADRRHECTSREDLEWALSRSAGFDAGYGITIHPKTLQNHGQMDTLLQLIKQWNGLRESGSFTEEQKERLRQTANEFRLELDEAGQAILYPISISRVFTCALEELQPGQPGGADWSVENPQQASFALRLQAKGGWIKNPMFTTSTGKVQYPCTVEDGQYLLVDLDGKALVTDKNYNTVLQVEPVGEVALAHGQNAISFSCGFDREEAPDVLVRFITRGPGEALVPKAVLK